MDRILAWGISIWQSIAGYVHGWLVVIAILFAFALLTGCFMSTLRPAVRHLVKADAMLSYLASSEKRAEKLHGLRKIKKHALKAERLLGAYAYDHAGLPAVKNAQSSVAAAIRALSSLSEQTVSDNPQSVLKVVRNAHKLVSAALKSIA